MSTEVIGDFICCGKYMVVVRLEYTAHVMPYDEWKTVYGKLHPERWENREKNRKKKKTA